MATPWPEALETGADVTLPLLAWGYHFDIGRWDALLARLPADRAMANPASLLAWNTRKTYLAELERAGVSTIPTLFTNDPPTEDLAALRARFGTPDLVVKPQVSAGSHKTLRLGAGDAAPEGFGAAMIQPFLPNVADEGELSLFMIGGRLAYAVRKVATGGDFRVQPQFGGRFALFDPEAEALALANAAVAACPVPPVYARADMVRGLDGRLQLMELECIEPDLYLDLAPDGGRGFVQAVLETLTPR
ncbi:ATP-grasp domain protein [soil metagenome]